MKSPTYAYLHNPTDKRTVTLAYMVLRGEEIGVPEGEYVAHVGYSICHPDDQHTKRHGRRVAEGRMAKTPIIVRLGDLINNKDRLVAIVAALVDAENLDVNGSRFIKSAAWKFLQDFYANATSWPPYTITDRTIVYVQA